MIVGDRVDPTARDRAAAHVLAAKAHSVPVALVSVRLQSPCTGRQHEDAALRILAEAESITTCDTYSATLLTRCMGRRVATTAPLELVLSAKPTTHAERAVALDAEVLARMEQHDRRVLLEALADLCTQRSMQASIVCAHQAPDYRVPDTIDCIAVPTWSQWMRALGQVRICIAAPDSVALHLAVAQGAFPIPLPLGSASELTERIGLQTVSPGMCRRSWDVLFEDALQNRIDDVCARSAPLRAVAWRALGSLSEAVRSRALPLQEDGALNHAVASMLATRWRHLLECGDFPQVEKDLSSWNACASTPTWAAARAHAWILQGQDDAARAVLEETLTRTPQDSECLSLLAMILWRAGDVQAAGRCWTRVIAAGGEAARAAQEQQDALLLWEAASTPTTHELSGSGEDPSRTPVSPIPSRRPAG